MDHKGKRHTNDPSKQIENVLKDLRLPENFLDKLSHEDDWSFIVKGHALMESAVIYILSHNLKQKKLETPFSEIDMFKRIKFLSCLNLLSHNDREMLRTLSKLRNDVVHRIELSNFSFANYLTNRDIKKNFIKTFSYNLPNSLEIKVE